MTDQIKPRAFDISDVLSIVNGALVSTRHMDGIYDILNFMTGDNLFTHALPRAAKACKPVLLRQFPQLAEASTDAVGPHNYKEWLQSQREKHGDSFDVYPLEAWRSMHPLAEPILDGKEVIAVEVQGS